MVRKAFIFGSNYKNTPYELKGCIPDCTRIANILKNKGYIVDENKSENNLDWNKIRDKLNLFLKSLKSGDYAVVYYSGHGLQVTDNNKDEKDNKDEAIFISSDTIVKDDTLTQLFQQVTTGVKILTIFDSCHSGTILDLPYRFNDMMIIKDSNNVFKCDIICISGCYDPDVSYEVDTGGFLTTSFIKLFQRWMPKIYPSVPWIDFYLRSIRYFTS